MLNRERSLKRLYSLLTITLVSLLFCLLFSGMIEAYDQSKERIVVLNFQTLDEMGHHLDPVLLKEGDLISLSRVLSMGVVSRLVQYGQFHVVDVVTLKEELTQLPYREDATPYEQARVLLTEHSFHQVITGTIVLLQSGTVVSLQRYSLKEGKPRLIGSSMAQSGSIREAPQLIDTLVSYLFPYDVQIIERTIDQVYVVPSQLRLNLGASHQITAIALDNKGRPVVDPYFLFISHDENRVHVDEEGVITALQPGSATVTVRGLTGTAGSGPPTTLTVVIVPPAIGIRMGGTNAGTDEMDGIPIRFGMRFTPSFDAGSKSISPEEGLFTDTSNPLAIISSFFSSLLTSGMMTFDLDFDPNKEMVFVLSGVQRTKAGYMGTGFGYVTPLGTDESQGFTLRFTAGTQMHSMSRVSFPVEAVLDMIFPADTPSSPVFRVGINLGLDLFP